jgi:hypothetical protein
VVGVTDVGERRKEKGENKNGGMQDVNNAESVKNVISHLFSFVIFS